MAVNIPGLVAVVFFYIVILLTGIWASRKSKKVGKTFVGSKSELTIVGGRNINTVVGIFTLTGRYFTFYVCHIVVLDVCARSLAFPLLLFFTLLFSVLFF